MSRSAIHLRPMGSASAAASIPWYLSGGISAANCLVAYKAIGAANLAESYINLANPGVNDAVSGAGGDPTFNTATGWAFPAWTRCPKSIVQADGQSIIIRAAQAAGDGDWFLFGGKNFEACIFIGITVTGATFVLRRGYGVTVFGDGNAITAPPADSVYAITPAAVYVNGVKKYSITPTPFVSTATSSYIGQLDGYYFTGTVAAYAVHDITLSDAQVLALSNAMAALP